jgi:hypothetical protein
MTTATLTASSDPGSRGRQRISAILGVDKGKLELRQLGRGRDKTSCTTTVDVTPGIYLVTDAATSTKVRNGGSVSTTDRYMLVWDDETTGRDIEISETQALDIASQRSAGRLVDWSRLGREATVAWHRAARRAEIQRLTGGPSDLPIEIDDRPSDPRARRAQLLAEADALHARLTAIDDELRALDQLHAEGGK